MVNDDTIPGTGVLSVQSPTQFKRQTLRKGTHSCWECKRRKTRCVVEPGRTICKGCQRRGSACISQEIPEDLALRIATSHETPPKSDHPKSPGSSGVLGNDGVYRAGEYLISRQQLTSDATSAGLGPANYIGERYTSTMDFRDGDTTRSMQQTNLETSRHQQDGQAYMDNKGEPVVGTQAGDLPVSTQISNNPEYIQPRLQHHSVDRRSKATEMRLEDRLCAALPSAEDTRKIYIARPLPNIPAYDLMTLPYTILTLDDLNAMPTCSPGTVDKNCHAVLIARHMLMLASVLQHLDDIQGLSERPKTICQRMARMANHYVTSKDEMLGSLEGLECVLIESVYQANLGNLRQSWMTARRALSIAQLIGLDRQMTQCQVLEPTRHRDPRILWRRILFLENFLSLMLNLPSACPEPDWASRTTTDGSVGSRLERIHCIVANHILGPNRNQITTRSEKIRELDTELQKAARSLPTKWWLVPRLDKQADPQTMYYDTGRIFAQVLHYNLVYRLHLPYMFRLSKDYEYSRIAGISASREILTRYLSLRTFNNMAYSCRILDFIAMMTSLTLLLLHLQSQGLTTGNFLAHQYHSDRDMIERVQECMHKAEQIRADPLAAQSANLLRRLMALDHYDTGTSRSDHNEEVTTNMRVQPAVDDRGEPDGNSVIVQIPYFGVIKIARDSNLGLIFQRDEVDTGGASIVSSMDIDGPSQQQEADQTQAAKLSSVPANNLTDMNGMQRENEVYPGLIPGLEDWAFQGIDMAFFDTILQGMQGDGDLQPEGVMNCEPLA